MRKLAFCFLLGTCSLSSQRRPDPAALISPAELQEDLAFAKGVWAVDLAEIIELRFEPLGACPAIGHQDLANTQVKDIHTTLTFDDPDMPPATSIRYSYIIIINSRCDWSVLSLPATMTHELGHVLIGAAYHSKDPASIMFPTLHGKGQSVTREDRALLAAKLAS